MSNKENYKTVLSEDLRDKLEAILEHVKDLPVISDRLGRIENKIDNLDARLEVVEEVLKQHSAEIAELKAR